MTNATMKSRGRRSVPTRAQTRAEHQRRVEQARKGAAEIEAQERAEADAIGEMLRAARRDAGERTG